MWTIFHFCIHLFVLGLFNILFQEYVCNAMFGTSSESPSWNFDHTDMTRVFLIDHLWKTAHPALIYCHSSDISCLDRALWRPFPHLWGRTTQYLISSVQQCIPWSAPSFVNTSRWDLRLVELKVRLPAQNTAQCWYRGLSFEVSFAYRSLHLSSWPAQPYYLNLDFKK